MAKLSLPNSDPLARKIERIIKRFAWLDDAEKVITSDPDSVRRAINDFVFEMRIITQVADKDGLQSVAADMQKSVVADLEKYDLKIKPVSITRANQAVRAVVVEQSETARTILTSIRGRLNSRYENLLIQAAALDIPGQKAAAAGKRTLEAINFTSKGFTRTVTKADLSQVWDSLIDRYGQRDTITYINGTNYPLTSYLDGKLVTVNREVQNVVSSIEAAANGIYTGQIEAYGASDSCALWEGAVVFYTQFGKTEFIKLYGDQYPEASRWKTVDEIKRDKTHMFGFHCRHDILPLPLGLIDRKYFDDVELNSPKIPKTASGIRLLMKAEE